MVKGKKIFITGGSSGIGLSCARLAVSKGARVTIMGRSEKKLAAVKAELGEYCFTFQGDVSDPEVVKRAVDFAVDSMGGLDGAVNSAGSAHMGGRIYEMDDDAFDETLKLDLYGVMYCVREESAYMKENGVKGSIVNISSLNSTVPYRMYTPYDVAKAGVDMLTKTACLELGPFGIRINSLCPGFTDTPLTHSFHQMPGVIEEIKARCPLRRMGTAEEQASVALFLLSDMASYVNGVVLNVDGGMAHSAYPDIFKDIYGEEGPNAIM